MNRPEMTPRERELAQRNLATLTNLRDAKWLRVHDHNGGHTQDLLMEHEALDYAVKLAENALQVPA